MRTAPARVDGVGRSHQASAADDDFAVGYCGNLTAGVGLFGSLGVCLYFPDSSVDGDPWAITGITASYTDGVMVGASASADAGAAMTTHVTDLNRLEGSANVAGASAKFGEGPVVAAEASWAEGPDGSVTGTGYAGLGVGVGTPEAHFGESETMVLTVREVIDWLSELF